MAAVAKLQAVKSPPFYLLPSVHFEEYATVKLSHTHTPVAGGPEVTRKQDVPFCADPSDKERLVRVLHEFVDACHNNNNLHIHDGDRYTQIRHVFGGDLKSEWDSLVTIIPVGDRIDANFILHLRAFVAKFLPSNAFSLQDEYLRNSMKPRKVDCYSLAGRLRLLNTLSQYLPGSAGARLFAVDTAIKNAFYRLMPPMWQLEFNKTGHRLDDAAYTMDSLINYMEQQRLFMNVDVRRRRQDHFAQPPNAPSAAGYFDNSGCGSSYPRYSHYPNSPYRSPSSPRQLGGYGGGRHSPFSPRRHAPYSTPTPIRALFGARGLPPTGRGRGGPNPPQPPFVRPPYNLRSYARGNGPHCGGSRIPAPRAGPRAQRHLNFYADQHFSRSGGGTFQYQDHYFQEEDNYYQEEDVYMDDNNTPYYDHPPTEEHHDAHFATFDQSYQPTYSANDMQYASSSAASREEPPSYLPEYTPDSYLQDY